MTLRVRLDAAAALASEEEREPENPVDALADDLDRYSVVLTEGRFTNARGFTLSRDGTQAVFAKTPWEDRGKRGDRGTELVVAAIERDPDHRSLIMKERVVGIGDR